MKLLISILAILALNGCNDNHICPPQKPCLFPKIPTYKAPESNKITKPIVLKDGTCIIKIYDLKQLLDNNKILRKQLWKCTKIAIKINDKYQK